MKLLAKFKNILHIRFRATLNLAIIISYPTSSSGIIVLLKTPENRGELQ